MALLKFNQTGKTRTWATSNEAEADVIYFCSDGTIVLNKQVCGSYSVEATSGRTNKVGKVKVNGSDIIVYEHPTTTAQAAAAKKVGHDDMGHVVLGDSLTKSDVGLSNVDNKSAATLKSEFAGSIADGNTGFVTGDAVYDALANKLDASKRGVANGVASLDANGKVPAIQLPSYVDDVVELKKFVSSAATKDPEVEAGDKVFCTADNKIYEYETGETYEPNPTPAETDKIYITTKDGKIYRFGGTAMAEISPSPGSTDAVPEGTNNKYFTEARAKAAVVSGTPTSGNIAKFDSNGKVTDSGVGPDALERTANRVTTVRDSSTATDDKYPSEKAVRTAINNKKTSYNDLESTLQGKVDDYDGHVGDAPDMSPKALNLYKIAITEHGHISNASGSAPTAVVKADLVNLGVEDASNKVTTISNTSTDTQYPSAKCVYGSMEIMYNVINLLTNRVAALEAALTLEKAAE